MRRFSAAAFFVVVLSALTTALAVGRTRAVRVPSEAVGTSFGAPHNHLTTEERARFFTGLSEFIFRRSAGDGLGPLFNGEICRNCHSRGGTGGGSGAQVTRVGTVTDGVFDPLSRFGGSIIQREALGAIDVPNHPFKPDLIPAGARFISLRRSPPLFGLGLVDQTPDETFLALAAMQAISDPSTGGRAAIVTNLSTGTKTVGKFGWKAQVPTLFQFSGDAYLNELGVTSPQFPDENCPSGNCDELKFNPMPGLNDNGTAVRHSADFMLLLGPPPRNIITADVLEGEKVFARIGCGTCHMPTLTSGSSEVVALDHKNYHPYSDFLLHDMGSSLDDGIEQESAKGNEFRTAPLWGVRVMQGFLHDGSARTLEDAIVRHDGQGRKARDQFIGLGETDRARLIAFLNSL